MTVWGNQAKNASVFTHTTKNTSSYNTQGKTGSGAIWANMIQTWANTEETWEELAGIVWTLRVKA